PIRIASSLPTAANQEDYVSMATNAARRLLSMTANARLRSPRALELPRPLRSSMALETVVMELRTQAPTWAEDRYFATDIEAGRSIVADAVGRPVLSAELCFLRILSRGSG